MAAGACVLRPPQVACSNWKRIMIVLSEGLLKDGVPQRDPLAIPRTLVHNSSMHFTFNKFWRRYGKFAKHLMKVGFRRLRRSPRRPDDAAFSPPLLTPICFCFFCFFNCR